MKRIDYIELILIIVLASINIHLSIENGTTNNYIFFVSILAIFMSIYELIVKIMFNKLKGEKND